VSLQVTEVLHIGFVIQESDKQITLSPTTFVDGGSATCPYHSPVVIPKVAILERGAVDIIPNEKFVFSGNSIGVTVADGH
jgi:hypothetical protein